MNKEAFKNSIFSLADSLYPMMFRILGTDANTKDAIQDVMLKLWTKRERLTKHPNPTGFVFLTARNHCYDLLKKKTRVTDELLDTHTVAHVNESGELTELVKEILIHCTIPHKEILLLRDLDGLAYDEIAVVTGLTVEHIRVVISRLRRYMQKQLTENYHYEK